MQIVNEAQHRVLAFIDAVTASGYHPHAVEVEQWMDQPHPREATYRHELVDQPGEDVTPLADAFDAASTDREDLLRSLRFTTPDVAKIIQDSLQIPFAQIRRLGTMNLGSSTRTPRTRRILDKPAETTLEHLVRIQWVHREGDDDLARVSLTQLGKALLRRVEVEGLDDDVQVVVLGSSDPIAYPRLIGQLAALGPGLLVDPYLKITEFLDLVQNTKVNRFLMANRSKAQLTEFVTISLYAKGSGRNIEVRASDQLHDRYVVPDEGSVYSLGTSLNGVGGRTTTVFNQLPPPGADTMRRTLSDLWDASAPEPVVEDDPEVEG